jgi:hypothetical protein
MRRTGGGLLVTTLFASDTLFVTQGQSEEGTAVGTKEQRPWYQWSVMN